MGEYGWLIAGGAAATGAITVFWGYLRSFWQQVASYIIVNCDIRGNLAEAITFHCWKTLKTSPYGFRTYVGWSAHVRPTRRMQLIAMETVGLNTKLYWKGWLPIWVKRQSDSDKTSLQLGNDYYSPGLHLTFLRGTFNLDAFILDATDGYNRCRVETSSQLQSRHRICHIFGTDGKPANLTPLNTPDASDSGTDPRTAMQNRILQWSFNDLGSRVSDDALGQLALSPDAISMLEEVKQWIASENWYKSHGIPWRRGWGLYGGPGTGKTSLVRAVGEDFDLPIYAFHLSTLYNNELQDAWQKMLTNVPCIALVEDIDSVFDGRVNNTSQLTFDCLLNCIDGVERTDGVLLVITTNCLDKLDPALGRPENNKSTRPGRVDRVLQLGYLNKEGREKICSRILKEWPQVWDATVAAGQNETGAQFQERCTQLALKHHWTNETTFN